MDTPVDRLLDALRQSDLNPSPEALGRMVEYVKHNGDRGRIPVTEAISLYLHPVEEWPEQCPGSGVLVDECYLIPRVGVPPDCRVSVSCPVADCGQYIPTFWDGFNWRKAAHNRPSVNA